MGVSLEEASMLMKEKEAEEAAKKEVEQAEIEAEEAAAEKAAEDIAKTAVAAAAAMQTANLMETASTIPQATVGVNGCRSLKADRALDKWCANNCSVGFCPSETCTCATKSKAK